MTQHHIDRRAFLAALGAGAAAAAMGLRAHAAPPRPHIVVILADDLGLGDLRAFHPACAIATPHLDALAAAGRCFTDAHSASAVCTPTRYALLTGRYCWRTPLKRGVLNGYSPPLIPAGRMTIASLLKAQGYRTHCIGKWHLGLGWSTTDGKAARADNIAWDGPIAGGPCELGFDTFFGIPASLDMPPYVYVEGARALEAATAHVPDSPAPAYYRGGPAAPSFRHGEVLQRLGERAVRTIDAHARDAGGAPLFLYLPLASPHTPIVPRAPFAGTSGLGPYGDFVSETDGCAGQVLEALARNGMADGTLVVFAADNGFAPMAGLEALHALGHRPSGIYRGTKSDIFEGGHRVPMIVRWPGRVPAGTVCGDTAGLTDLMATIAEVCGVPLPPDAGEDSTSLLAAMEDRPGRAPREAIVHHSADGFFAVRQGPWKLIFCAHSGGWSAPAPKEAERQGLPPVQLYRLDEDPGEQRNCEADHPEIVAQLTALMQSYIDNGRSTPGPVQSNEGAVRLSA